MSIREREVIVLEGLGCDDPNRRKKKDKVG
jgi:hypothetical protein